MDKEPQGRTVPKERDAGLETVRQRSVYRRRRPELVADAEAEAEAAKLGARFRKQLGLRKRV